MGLYEVLIFSLVAFWNLIIDSYWKSRQNMCNSSKLAQGYRGTVHVISVLTLVYDFVCTSRQYRARSTDRFRVPASSLPSSFVTSESQFPRL